MAIQDIVKYIEDNKNKYPLVSLLTQLRGAGYPEQEIASAIDIINGGAGNAELTTYKKVEGCVMGFIAGYVVYFASYIFSSIFLGYMMYTYQFGIIVNAVALGAYYYFRYQQKDLYRKIGFGAAAALILVPSLLNLIYRIVSFY